MRPVTHRDADERFLRAAIKTGLRLQREEAAARAGKSTGGVATLQRIKASVRRRKTNLKPN